MHRIQKFLLAAFTIAIFTFTWSVSGITSEITHYKGSDGALCIPMGSFTINPPVKVNQKRSSVSFPHSKHFAYNCKVCHHQWDGTSKIKTCTTSGCHNDIALPKNPLKHGSFTAASIKYYKYAYHNKCRGCHQKIAVKSEKLAMSGKVVKDLPKAGPTGCTVCHPKQ